MKNENINARQDQLIDQAVQWIISGIGKEDVKKKLMETDTKLTYDEADDVIQIAMKELEEATTQDHSTVIANHVKYYELIYEYMKKVGSTSGMNKALRAKERLLNVLKDKNRWVINNKKNTIIEQVVEYDESKLTPEELKDYKELLEKMGN